MKHLTHSHSAAPKEGEIIRKDENKAESIYSHPNYQTTYDTYLSIAIGVTPQQGVHLGKWCTVREVLSDGTVITTEGSKLTPALASYAGCISHLVAKANSAMSPITLHVLAVNSKNPTVEFPKTSPMGQNGFQGYCGLYQPYNYNGFGNLF